MNKKVISLILLVAIILTMLNACRGTDMFDRINRLNRAIMSENKKAELTLKLIFEASEKRDKELLRTVFSQKALNATENLDERMDELFDVFEEGVLSWDDYSGPQTNEEIIFGDRIKDANIQCDVTTKSDVFYLYVFEYFTDTKNSDNVGVYTIVVMPLKDAEEKFGFCEDWRSPGIYVMID